MKFLGILVSLLIPFTVSAHTVQYVEVGNDFKVWTKRVGHGPIKILTLHGGPGVSCEYLEDSFTKYFPPDQYEIIYYAQLGSLNSDQPDDPSLWKIERFREEVETVRKALKLENFYLYGQSWGGMLAIEYALKYQHHLKGLILSNTPGSIASYETYIQTLRSKLPTQVQNQLQAYEKNSDFSNPKYQQLMTDEVYSRHICRLKPWPNALQQTFQHMNEKVYLTMQGPNEFLITGNFKNWDRWKDFPQIEIPTLVISGRYDTINPDDTIKIAKLMPKGTSKICEKGSHLSLYDDADPYFGSLREFLR